MKFTNVLKIEFKRSIMNPLFIGTIVLTCILFFMSGYEEFFIYAQQVPNMDVFHFLIF